MSYTLQEVAQHNNTTSCWVIIKDNVYDVTEFLPEHPGGAQIILKYAGSDATPAFESVHSPDTLKNLPSEKHLGALNVDSINKLENASGNRRQTEDELRVERERAAKPSISRILNLQQMTDVSSKVLTNKAFAFYASAADDEITKNENARAFSRFFFHPRILRPLSNCDPSTTILGFKSSIPVFVSATGLAKLGHPLGEANITQGAGRTNIIQMVSSSPSLTYAEIAASRVSPSQPLFFQLYKNRNHDIAEQRVKQVESLGYNAIFLTVDAPILGNRERDIRVSWEIDDMERIAQGGDIVKAKMPKKKSDMEEVESKVDFTGTVGTAVANDDTDMTWKETIPWLRKITKLPLVVKGIQTVEDAVLAAEAGVEGILLSNHGGRQLEYSLPPIEVLYRIRKQRPDIFDKLEIYMDGGVQRGTDVVKALCLGATAVGIGRPFLYAQSAYGAAGVVKIVRILQREIVSAMQLLGARSVKDLVPEMIERVDWQPILSKL